jgi:hypothetical protein
MFRTWLVRLEAMKFTDSVRSRQVPETPLTFGLAAELAVGAHLARHPRHLVGERGELADHRVDGVLELEDLALDVDRDLLREVAVRHRRRDLRDVAHLAGEVGGHQVHRLRQVLPGAGDVGHFGLAAQLALGAHLAGHAGDLLGEDGQGAGHLVDDLGQLGDLALGLDGDLLRQVASGHRLSDLGDVSHLVGEVGGHEVHRLGEVAPGAENALDLGLAAELAVGAHLARHPRHLVGERGQLGDHRVHRRADAEELALDRLTLDRQRHRLAEVTVGDGVDHACDLGGRPHQIVDQVVDRVDARLPAAAGRPERGALVHPALAPDHPPDAAELLLHARVHADELVVGGGDLTEDAAAAPGQAVREVAVARGDQRLQDLLERGPVELAVVGAIGRGAAAGGAAGVRLLGKLCGLRLGRDSGCR